MNADIPNLTIATTTTGTIELEQQNGLDEPDRIEIHPLHLRYMAEQIGLVPTSDPAAAGTIARLSRQLRILFDRINQLDDWLNAAAQRGHEDLEAETIYSFATWELANEFVSDLPADGTCHAAPMANASHTDGTAAAIPPENGCIESPQKRGPSLFE